MSTAIVGKWRGSGIERSGLIIDGHLESWKYCTRNLLCTSVMIDQNASERVHDHHS